MVDIVIDIIIDSVVDTVIDGMIDTVIDTVMRYSDGYSVKIPTPASSTFLTKVITIPMYEITGEASLAYFKSEILSLRYTLSEQHCKYRRNRYGDVNCIGINPNGDSRTHSFNIDSKPHGDGSIDLVYKNHLCRHPLRNCHRGQLSSATI